MKTNSLKYLSLLLPILLGSNFFASGQACFSPKYEARFVTPQLIAPHKASGGMWLSSDHGFMRNVDADLLTSQTHIASAANIWIAGRSPAGEIKAAANFYGPGTDYWPGPLSADGNISNETCDDYDFIWEVKGQVIDKFRMDWNADGQIDDPISVDLLAWPGKDNPHSFEINGFNLPEGREMAPFIDVNNDNKYDPEKGDYPDIRNAKLAHWWIFNDKGNLHGITHSNPIKVEISCLAFSYDTETSSNPAIYYEYQIENKSAELLSDTYVGLWVDPSIGCLEKEIIGCSSEQDLAYFFSSTSIESGCECPAGWDCGKERLVGIKIIQGIGNEQSENLGMTSFSYHNTSGIGNFPNGTFRPSDKSEFYNYLQGIWRDGTPMTAGEFGYNLCCAEETKFAFDGNPADSNDWSLCAFNESSDRRMIIGSGPTTLQPGVKQKFVFALVVSTEVDALPCPDITPLITAANAATETFENTTSVINLPSLEFAVFPNPATDVIRVQLENGASLSKIRLINSIGQVVENIESTPANIYELSINQPAGIYFLEVHSTGRKIGIRKIMIL